MHPIFNSPRSMTAILIVWLFVCGFCTGIMTLLVANSMAPIEPRLVFEVAAIVLPWYGVLLFICLSNFYVCIRYPLKNTAPLYLTLMQVISLCAAIGLWLGLGTLWIEFLQYLGMEQAPSLFYQALLGNGLLAACLYALWVLLHYIYLAAYNGEVEQSDVLAQRLLISEVELQAIKATMHPHFLYNSLNMLANLSLVAPDKIHPLCIKMSEFLRYSVGYGNKSHVTLAEEVDHIKNYLAIERERFGERLKLKFTLADELENVTVFPLLLFPLVENCIKHGVDSSLNESYIEVEIKKSESAVTIKIENSLDPEGQKPPGTQHGLSSVQKRLRSYFGADASLQTQALAQAFVVRVTVPINTPINRTLQVAKP